MCSESSVEYYAGYAKALEDLLEYTQDRVDPWLYKDLQEIVQEMKDEVGVDDGSTEDPRARIPA